MNQDLITVLLVEDDIEDARLIETSLSAAGIRKFQIETVASLAAARECLNRSNVDIILLDLTLPDGQGIDAFHKAFELAPNALILILCATSDEDTARQAVQGGANDYFIKQHVDAHWLPRALHYIIECRTAQDGLRNSEARFRAMSDASPLGIFVSDAAGECVYSNAAYQEISGLTLEQTLGTNWSMAIHPEERQQVLAAWHAAAHEHEPFQVETRFFREDESIVWARLNAAAMGDGRKPRGHVQTVENITERKASELILQMAEEALFAEKERAQVTLNSIGDAVLSTDIHCNVTYMNLVAEDMTGWFLEEAIGKPVDEVFRIIDGKTNHVAPNPAQRAIDENQTVGLATDCLLVRRDGFESAIEDSAAPIHNREGRVVGAVLVFHDVTQSRAMALKMSHLAQHDFLTGLPNRVLLTERLSQAIGQAHRRRKQVGLLFLDLDYFKHINDSLGHAVGDQLLQSVAERLTACVRTTDTVSRQGGDEFVILLSEIEQPQDAANIAEKLLSAFSSPHLISNHELHVTLSIGISVYPDDGIDADVTMQNADTAMYHAKANGRNCYLFFKGAMNTRAVHRLFIESSLRRALKQNEFVLHYQPQIDLASGAMVGTEALIRWNDKDLGLIYPGHFIPIAEECGLIVPIGRWVLHEACRQVSEWLAAGLRAVPVAVNISAVEFRHKNFLEDVASILKETGVPAEYLELELTESILMHDAESSAEVLAGLKAMGLKLAIDDFGTGYSSLSYLKSFPIDTLKIDKSFMHEVATDLNNAAIVSAVIGMGSSLKQRVIAEGVEAPEQLSFLCEQKCDLGQGFQFSHPLTADDFSRWLVSESGDQLGPSGQGQLWSAPAKVGST